MIVQPNRAAWVPRNARTSRAGFDCSCWRARAAGHSTLRAGCTQVKVTRAQAPITEYLLPRDGAAFAMPENQCCPGNGFWAFPPPIRRAGSRERK
jgi:hypothetical protein